MIWRHFSATRVAAFTFGVFGGVLGVEHGYFETLQGNVAPDSIVIRAIGAPCQPATAQNGCEPAMTIIPNFLITGILAILVSLLIIIWASLLIRRRNSGPVKLWPWALLASVIWHLGINSLEHLLGLSTTELGLFGLIFCLLAILTGFMHDVQRQTHSQVALSIRE